MSDANTIRQTVADYLALKAQTHSINTVHTYRNALRVFLQVLQENQLHPDTTPPTAIPEESISWFAGALKKYSPATEQLYLVAAMDFLEYLVAERLSEMLLPRVRQLAKRRMRRPGQRLPQFPQEDIEKILGYATKIAHDHADHKQDQLRNLRDCCFLLTLADTGLRVHEACNLRRGDLDWNEGRAIVIGKGNREAVVRFSARAMRAIKTYLSARAALDGSSGRQLSTLPIFARHDRGASNKVIAITTTTGRNIVKQRVKEALGPEAVGTITPHSFRHYFVTIILRSSGNLKLAQELARHRNIAITQRYAHLSDDELDRGYHDIFEDDE